MSGQILHAFKHFLRSTVCMKKYFFDYAIRRHLLVKIFAIYSNDNPTVGEAFIQGFKLTYVLKFTLGHGSGAAGK